VETAPAVVLLVVVRAYRTRARLVFGDAGEVGAAGRKMGQRSAEFCLFCAYSLDNCFGRAIQAETSHASRCTPEAESACCSVFPSVMAKVENFWRGGLRHLLLSLCVG